MSAIQINDKQFIPFISENEIKIKVKELANQLSNDYQHKKPLFIVILNGSFMFASDIFKELNIEAEISFIKLASYKGMKSSGEVITSIGLDNNITDRDIIIVEDIIDTGKTLFHFLPQLLQQKPNSLKVAVLLDKPEPRKYDVTIDYKCFTIENKFVVGYGLDYDGLGRNINCIYQLDTKD